MRALVVGGYHAQMRGAWGRALKDKLGIEIAHACCADDNFRGLPATMPKGIDLVLVVAGTCSHKASERVKLLVKSGVRCETVSKDTVRTVDWLIKRGYAPQTPATAIVETDPTSDQPAQEDTVIVAPEQQQEWLDLTQVRALMPDLNVSTFYDLERAIVLREPRQEQRTYNEGGKPVTRRRKVWTLEEIMEIEQVATKRGLMHKKTDPRVIDSPVSDSPVSDRTFEQTFRRCFDPTPPPPSPTQAIVDEMDGLVRAAEALVAARTSTLTARVSELLAENEALKAQLERVKAALGV